MTMTTPKEHDKPQASAEYQRAEQMSRQSIAKMDNEAHIEYDSTIQRTPLMPKWRQWLNRVMRLTT